MHRRLWLSVAMLVTGASLLVASSFASAAGNADALKKGGILLQWAAPHVGTVVSYDVYRVIGTSITPQNFATRLAIGPVLGSTFVTDNFDLKRNVTYTYVVVANLVPTADCPAATGSSVCRSGGSNHATVTY